MIHNPLTPKQLETLQFIKEYSDIDGIAPTYREISSALDIQTTTAFNRVEALVRKGYLDRMPGVARGLRIPSPKTKIRCPHCCKEFER